MKLVMTLLVRDEEDVLRANIEFHLAQGVDYFLVTDNKSEDGTPDIIREYEAAGVARYIHEADDNYNQAAWVTRMARMAATEHAADWIINNDADEFWWPRQGSLKECFAAIPDEYNIVVGQRHDFVPLAEEQGCFYEDMVFRKKVSLNTIGKPLPPKVAHRGDPQVNVAQGNHWAELTAQEQILENILDIFHFPIRRYSQFTNKIIKGGQAYERNTTQSAQAGDTWRKLYKEYQKNGLVDFYRKQSMSAKQLEQGLRHGDLITDRRLADFLAQTDIADRLAATRQDSAPADG
jgi:hypothetical protein